MNRIRIFFAVRGLIRFTGSIDLMKIWERSIRRARLPLAYSQGFHPQPKIQLAFPLPLGYCSEAEIIDLWFENHLGEKQKNSIQAMLPEGLVIKNIIDVPVNSSALMSRVNACEYQVVFQDIKVVFEKKQMMELLSHDEIFRIRRSKSYNLRPLILSINGNNLPFELSLKMKAGANQTGRPEELLDELQCNPDNYIITRKLILFSND